MPLPPVSAAPQTWLRCGSSCKKLLNEKLSESCSLDSKNPEFLKLETFQPLNLSRDSHAQIITDRTHVLIASAGEVDNDRTMSRQTGCEPRHCSNSMSAFQCRDDPFNFRQKLDRVNRFAIGCRDKLDSAPVAQIAEFRADAGVVQSRRHRMRSPDLPPVVLKNVALTTVKHADVAAKDRSRVFSCAKSAPRCFHTEHFYPSVLDEGIKQSHRVAPAADASDEIIRQASFRL